jgi:capsular polysaccharide export protein
VLDRKGIYYDSSGPSELECILEKGGFDDKLLERARRIRQEIIRKEITKYNVGTRTVKELNLPRGQELILVPGQVENDASILHSSSRIITNLKLLEAVRDVRPNAFILYKPHPDVLAGNRPGGVPPETALKSCDLIVGNISAAALTGVVDEVHTMSSLTGFEALLRGKQVHTYGGPFYGGWGLTTDRQRFPRRTRKLTLDELVAGTLILYPTYYDWDSGQFCQPETILRRLSPQPNLRSGSGSNGTITKLIRLLLSPYLKTRRHRSR